MKEIRLSLIAKIQRLYIKQFAELDQDYPDYRIVAMYERNMNRYLQKITDNIDEQRYIFNAITNGSWCPDDLSFKPICDKLRDLGYVIVEK